MVVRCEGETWNVHRVILASSPSYFAKACEGNFLVRPELDLCRGSADCISRRAIKLREDDSEMVHQMLSCFYDRNYEDNTNGKNPLDFNAVMYAIADKYDVPLLKDLAEMKFSAAIIKYNTKMTPRLVKAIKIIFTCLQHLWSESAKQ